MGNRLLLTSTVQESLLHIVDKVADQSLRWVVNRLGYRDLFKDNIIVSTDFRQYSKTHDKNHAAATRGSRVLAKLNPNVNPSSIKWEASGTTRDLANGNTPQQNPDGGRTSQRLPWAAGNHISMRHSSIFRDDYIGVDLSERSLGSSLSMEVTMEFEDEHVANEAISRIYQCFTNGDMINYVDVMYDYPIPNNFQAILKYLYHLKCMDAEHPNGALDDQGKFKTEEWYNYLQKFSNGAITYLFNRNHGKYQELVVNKNHFQALYLIECSQETPAPLDPEGASVTFNLTVQYSRSNILALEYPIIVNNQYVDQKYVPMERQYRAHGLESMVMWQNPSWTAMWHRTYSIWPPKPFMFPFWDPWLVPTDSRIWMNRYRPILIAAFTVDEPENPDAVTTFDFDTDVEAALESRLDPAIIDCIHTKKNRVLGVDEFVNIAVFADDVAVYEKDHLDISDGHTLKIKNRRTTPIYRMVVSIAPPVGKAKHQWNRVWITNIKTHKEKA